MPNHLLGSVNNECLKKALKSLPLEILFPETIVVEKIKNTLIATKSSKPR